MVTEQVVESPILAHIVPLWDGDASRSGDASSTINSIIFGDDSIGHLVMAAYEVGRCRTEACDANGFQIIPSRDAAPFPTDLHDSRSRIHEVSVCTA